MNGYMFSNQSRHNYLLFSKIFVRIRIVCFVVVLFETEVT